MANPRTPTKVSDELEQIKLDLSSHYGFPLPSRGPGWSPSKSDRASTGDVLATKMQFLFYKNKDGLLEAISRFRSEAPAVIANWKHKPLADDGAKPTRQIQAETTHFLSKRAPLTHLESEKLLTRLLYQLNAVIQKAKPVQDRSPSGKVPHSIEVSDEAAMAPREQRLSKAFRQTKLSHLTKSLREASIPFPFQGSEYFAIHENEVKQEVERLVQHAQSADVTPLETADFGATTGLRSRPAMTQQAIKPILNSDLGCQTTIQYPKLPHSPGALTSDDAITKPDDSLCGRKRSIIISDDESFPSKVHRDSLDSRPSSSSSKGSVDDAAPCKSSPGQALLRPQMTSLNSSSTSVMTTSMTNATSNPSKNTSFSSSDSVQAQGEVPCLQVEGADKINMVNHNSDDASKSMHLKSGSAAASEIHKSVIHDHAPSPTFQKSMSLIAARLKDSSFHDACPIELLQRPLRQRYEIVRVSQATKVDVIRFQPAYNGDIEDYEQLWRMLSNVVKESVRSDESPPAMPERSTQQAWRYAMEEPLRISLTGALYPSQEKVGRLFKLHLYPLKIERSYRLARQFGRQRFLDLQLPRLDFRQLCKIHQSDVGHVRRSIVEWFAMNEHSVLGQRYRVYHSTQEKSRKASDRTDQSFTYKLYLFATQGPHIPTIAIDSVLEWFMSPSMNADLPALKFFARLQLATSKTIASVKLSPEQIYRADDAYAGLSRPRRLDQDRSNVKKKGAPPLLSDAVVMNDGCSRMSLATAKKITDDLGLDYIPCAFQGRVAGAKGMWMLECHERPNELWIEITDSQNKFEAHIIDSSHPESNRVTFEVNNYVKPLAPASLNMQFIPILEERGVPRDVFAEMLQQDLARYTQGIEEAMGSPEGLRLWNQRNGTQFLGDGQDDRSEVQLGMSRQRNYQIKQLLDAGFDPLKCKFLYELGKKAIQGKTERLSEKMDIEIAQSTSCFILADPYDVLEEGEVHLSFSRSWPDTSFGLNENELHDLDLLVARSPARMTSDIQRVRAVFKLELRHLKDVLVMSSKGDKSLASMLSGGDYDGDTVFACWDQRLVAPFTNARVPVSHPPQHFGIIKDAMRVGDFFCESNNQFSYDKFISYGIQHALNENMLGICSIFHEKLCYSSHAIESPKAIELAEVCSHLVDANKQGYTFNGLTWSNYLRSRDLANLQLKDLAYKGSKSASPTSHILDHLRFKVTEAVIGNILRSLNEKHSSLHDRRDEDLLEPKRAADKTAEKDGAYRYLLNTLKKEFEKVCNYWAKNCRGKSDSAFTPKSGASQVDFMTVQRETRQRFLDISPVAEGDDVSDRFRDWFEKHKKGLMSDWDLLKASALYDSRHKGRMVWYVAGHELCIIKAQSRGRNQYRPVVSNIHKLLKIDGKAVKGLRSTKDLQGEDNDSDGEYGDDAELMELMYDTRYDDQMITG